MSSRSIIASALLSSVALLQSASASPIVVHSGTEADVVSTPDNTFYGKAPGEKKFTVQQLAAEATLNFSFTNWLQDTNVWAYVYGQDSNGQYAFANPADPTQFYYPQGCVQGSNTQIDNSAIGFQLGGYNTQTTAAIPGYLAGGRVYLGVGEVQFSCNLAASGAVGIVTPAVNNVADPNNGINYAFMELTWNDGGLTTDISAVDLVGLPLGIAVTDSNGGPTTTIQGLNSTSVNDVCNALKAQSATDGAAWEQECVYLEGQTDPFRVISPVQLLGVNSTAFDGYFDDYINQVYGAYTSTPLMVNGGTSYVSCTATDNVLNCDGQGHSYGVPSPSDIFGCPAASGTFAVTGGNDGVVAPILCAAFNRGTFLLPANDAFSVQGMTCAGSVQPCLPPSSYYPAGGVYNYYSAIVHQHEVDNQGYAFAYDDNDSPNTDGGPFGGAVAGVVNTATPGVLEVLVGGYDLAPQ